MIQQTFGVADGSCGMVRCKRESLIPNAAADEAVDADKRRNAAADEAVDADKRQNAAASKQSNAAADEALDADKDQTTRLTKLGGWMWV